MLITNRIIKNLLHETLLTLENGTPDYKGLFDALKVVDELDLCLYACMYGEVEDETAFFFEWLKCNYKNDIEILNRAITRTIDCSSYEGKCADRIFTRVAYSVLEQVENAEWTIPVAWIEDSVRIAHNYRNYFDGPIPKNEFIEWLRKYYCYKDSKMIDEALYAEGLITKKGEWSKRQ